MNSSTTEFQTSGLVLLASTLIFTIFGAVIIAPMLSRQGVSSVVTSTDTAQQVPTQFAEFYPQERPTYRPRPNVTPEVVPARRTADRVPQEWPQSSRSPQEVEVSLAPEAPQSPYDQQIYRSVSSENHASRATPQRDAYAQQAFPDVPRLPGGSVYAPVTVHPVTVNVDGSMMDQQMKSMERRFEQFMQAQATQQPERKVNRTARKNRGRKNDERKVADSQLGDLSSDLQSLIATVSSLERQTKSNLNQVYRQHAASEAAALKRLREWEQALNERLRAQEVAVRTVIASRPNTIVLDRPVPQLQQTPPPAREETPASQPKASAVRDGDVAAAPAAKRTPAPQQFKPSVTAPAADEDPVPLPKPAPFVSRAPQQVQPAPVPLPQTVIRSAELPPVDAGDFPEPAPAVELAPVTQEFPVLEMSSPQPRSFPQPTFEPQSSVETEALKPESQKEVSIPLQAAAVSTSAEPLALDTHQNTAAKSEAEAEAEPNSERRMVSPVAFESVYRFTMSDDSESVVPAAGVCSQCGKTNCPGHQPQVEKQVRPEVSAERPAVDARGTLLPKLKIPTLKSRDDEPGVLHRLGSSIMKFGRRTID